MSLAVCCLVGSRAPSLAPSLARLRAAADEIVLGAYAHVPAEVVDVCEQVADQIHLLPDEGPERILPWLARRCSADWTLFLEGDELASAELVALLPELVSGREYQQVWLPRRWVYPDSSTWLAEIPWQPDFRNRLVRNDPFLSFASDPSAPIVPQRPARWVEAPLLKLACVVEDERARVAAAVRGHVERPQARAPGGDRGGWAYLVPERRPEPRLLPLSGADRRAVEEALSERLRPDAAVSRRPVAREEVLGLAPDRTIFPADCSGRVTPLDGAAVAMAPGELREMYFRVQNTGRETWLWDLDRPPRVRLSYHWHRRDGGAVLTEGPRSPLPCRVKPGAGTVAPVPVRAPEIEGEFELRVDLLLEDVRWFDAPAGVAVSVRKRPPARPAQRPPRNGAIPRVIHSTWLDPNLDLPPPFRAYAESWTRHHPGWEVRRWGLAEAEALVPPAALARARSTEEATVLLHAELLRRHGGVCVCAEMECLRPIDEIVESAAVLAGWETENHLGAGLVAAAPAHPLVEELARHAVATAGLGPPDPATAGSALLTAVLEHAPAATLLPRPAFYPYRADERSDRGGPPYALRHWNL